MSLASDYRELGMEILSSAESGSGDTVTYRGGSIDVLINLVVPPDQPDVERGQRRDSDRGKSVIEILKSRVTSIPEVGEYLVDSTGRKHRIQVFLATTDITYVVECAVFRPPTGGSSS